MEVESVNSFLDYLETIKNKSVNTIDAYRKDLRIFFEFLTAKKKADTVDDEFLNKITLRDLYSFMTYCEKVRNNSAYARARKVATLKSYFNFIERKLKIIQENITLDLESPSLPKRNPKYLTLNQSVKLLKSLDKKDKNYNRDNCILTLFLNCGMRLSELCNIQVSKIKNDTLTIIGKGNKERTIYLNDACLKVIGNLLSERESIAVMDEDKDYLFMSNRARKISQRTVELMVKKYIDKNGFDEKITPHKLRHTSATLMYKSGTDIRSIQSILGHTNIATTQVYTHVDNDTLRDAVKSNPLSKL